eukprot:16449647-Heterocapsa_arctica.AAC.1
MGIHECGSCAVPGRSRTCETMCPNLPITWAIHTCSLKSIPFPADIHAVVVSLRAFQTHDLTCVRSSRNHGFS